MAWCNAWRCLPGPWAGALATIKIVCDAPKNSEAVGSSNANSLCGRNSAGSPEICATFQRDILPRRATKASFRLSVSEGHFWCLVFGRCGCSVKNSNERSRPPLSGECRLKRLVAGVSGYIFDECVTKCVAVLKQQGGFAPTVPSRRSKAG